MRKDASWIGSRVTERPGLVVFAVGNDARGDDAIGPVLVERLAPRLPCGTRIVTDFQLQIEHALDLAGASLALFIDAADGLNRAFVFAEVEPQPSAASLSHALEPPALLAVFERVEVRPPPPAFVLAVRGHDFGLGRPLSRGAREDVEAAFAFAVELLATPDAVPWRRRAAAAAFGSTRASSGSQRPDRAGKNSSR